MSARLRLLSFVFVIIGALLVPASANAAPSYVVVDDDGGCPDAAFTSIQAAIDAVAPGDSVVICPGDYPEQLTITKDVTLNRHFGDARPVVRAPAVVHELTCRPPGSGATAIVEVCGAGEVANFLSIDIAGPGPGPCASLDYGVLAIGGAEVFGFDLRVLDIRDEPASGCDSGVAIQAGNATWGETGSFATSGGLALSNYQTAGLVAEGAGSWVVLSGSPQISGMGHAAKRAQTGVHIGEGATGTVDGTVSGAITDHACDPAICTGTSIGVDIVDPVSNPSVSPSTVLTNTDVGGNDVGVRVVSRDGLADPSPVLIGQNDIHDDGIGVVVADDNADDAIALTVSGASNLITGNGAGVRNTAAAPVDFRRNWWGDPSGPSDWSIGTGDTVSARVQFFPWSIDTVFTTMAECDLTGSNGPDLLTGTDGSDIICGKKGADKIVGFGGNDLLLGDRGDDVIKGGSGDDALLGGNGDDVLRGRAGFDSIQGGPGADTCPDSDPGQTDSCS